MMRSNETNHDPARKYGKRVWKEMVEILPGLTQDFEKGEFRTSTGELASENEERFRFTVYLIGDGQTYKDCVRSDAERFNISEDRQKLMMQTGNYRDRLNRYLVLCKVDPKSTDDGPERDKTAVFAHSTAAMLVSGQARSTQVPFWMKAGIGYYAEHALFSKCRVLYLDFEKYYESDRSGETIKGGTLGPNDSWTRAVRTLSKKGKRVSLLSVMNAQITTLSPNQSGYIFALTSFLVSDDQKKKNYQQLIMKIRDLKPSNRGRIEVTEDLLLDTYGYDDIESFEKDWYAFVESSKFK